MENNERDRKLDQWLDEALSKYSAAEPRLGLEQRVLAQLRSEEKARAERRNWWRWMPAFAAIAAALIVAIAVKPYWESKKESVSTFTSPSAPRENRAADMTNEGPPRSGDKIAGTKKAAPRVADSRANEGARTAKAPEQTKDTATKLDAAVKPGEETPKPYLNRKELTANQNAPGRESDALSMENKSGRAFESIAPMTAAAPGASVNVTSGAAGGVIGGAMSEKGIDSQIHPAKVAAAPTPSRPPVPAQVETVEVQSSAQTVEVHNGIIGTERVKVPDVSKQLKAIKLKPKGSLARKLGEDVSADDGTGFTLLRTDLRHVPPGPLQQFPTPMPLSKEEELMLAAVKQLQGKPVNEVKNDSGIPAIEIKKVEIAPLAGPPN